MLKTPRVLWGRTRRLQEGSANLTAPLERWQSGGGNYGYPLVLPIGGKRGTAPLGGQA